MGGRRNRSTDRRQRSIEELEWYRLTLTTIGGLYGELAETQSWTTFEFLENFLSDNSTPTDWIKDGLAVWVEGIQAGAEVVRGISSALSRSIGPSEEQSGLYENGEIRFYVDEFTEATDPVPIEIPEAAIRHVTVGKSHPTLKTCINLTRNDGQVYVALADLPKDLPDGSHEVTLTWGQNSKTFEKTFKVINSRHP